MAKTSVGRVRAAAWAAAFGAALLISGPSALQGAQDSKSADIVKQLTQLLDAKKLDSIAAPDPQSPGTYVAALYFSGSQLLVKDRRYLIR